MNRRPFLKVALSGALAPLVARLPVPVTKSPDIGLGKWHGVMTVWDSEGVQTYVDGVLVGSDPAVEGREVMVVAYRGDDRTWQIDHVAVGGEHHD